MQHISGGWRIPRLAEVRKLSKQDLTRGLRVVMNEIYQKPGPYCGVWSFFFMWVESLLIPNSDGQSRDPRSD
jgi:hypothetical protein